MNIPNISGRVKDEVVLLYANFILSSPSDQDVIEFNKAIIDKWSNRTLAEIKQKAWNILESLGIKIH